jgi:hypothetical protein
VHKKIFDLLLPRERTHVKTAARIEAATADKNEIQAMGQ